jgi:hypothetical protein
MTGSRITSNRRSLKNIISGKVQAKKVFHQKRGLPTA